MRFIYVFFVFVSSGALAQGQSSCKEAAAEARRKCSAALREASSLGPAGAIGSMSGGASLQTAMMTVQSAKLKEATDFCKKQQQQCEGSCGESGGDTKTAGSTNGMGKTGMGNDLDNKSPAYIAAHKQCLDRGKDLCTTPLVLQLGSQRLKMTEPKNGAIFDLHGYRNLPARPSQKISWLDKASRKSNYFLALPNEKGEISGIKELFGNNTRGPDQKFADHGWAALQKYNSNADDVIDNKDAIFPRLRLWSDLNGNGKADKGEVFTLSDKHVESINLNFSDDLPDVDQHGNQMTMNSTVRLTNGESKLIFDLIFAPQD